MEMQQMTSSVFKIVQQKLVQDGNALGHKIEIKNFTLSTINMYVVLYVNQSKEVDVELLSDILNQINAKK